MRTSLDFALAYLEANPDHYIFPIKAGCKTPPLIQDNLKAASNDPAQVNEWHERWPGCNWGLALKLSNAIVVDVDCKVGKSGQKTFNELALLYGFPATRKVRTPSGGFHYYYSGEHVFALGSNGFGIDIDSPNYVLLAGCELTDPITGIATKYQLVGDVPVAPAPQWFFEFLGKPRDRADKPSAAPVAELDTEENIAKQIGWLRNSSPPSIELQGGDITTFKVACHLRDHGISVGKAFELMSEHYNVPFTCEPLWEPDALEVKIRNAYEYASLRAPGELTEEGQDDPTVKMKAASEAVAEFSADPPDTNRTPDQQKIAEDHDRLRKRDPGSTGEAKDGKREKIAEEWVYIEQQELWVNRETRETMTVRAFDRKFAYVQKKKLSDSYLTAKSKTARQFFSFTYAPGLKEFDVPHRYNLWRGGNVTPLAGDTSMWDHHLEYLFPEQADRDHVLNWLAWVYQNMSKKPKHMMILWGEHQGTGKSWIGKVFSQLIGVENVSEIEDKKLTGDFNGWARRCKLAIIEEVRDSSRTGAARALQSKITEERLMVNDKNVQEYAIDDCIAYLGFSNKADAISMDDTDRRYLIVRTHAMPKLDAAGHSDVAYYKPLFALLSNPVALGAIAHQLLTRDLGNYSAAAPAPRTTHKTEMMNAGRSEIERWVIDEIGNPPLSFKLVSISRDIIPEMPSHATRGAHSGLSRAIADSLRRFAQGEELTPAMHRLPNGERVRLWALHGSANMLRDVEPGARVAIYLKQREGVTTRADADAGRDFSDPAS